MIIYQLIVRVIRHVPVKTTPPVTFPRPDPRPKLAPSYYDGLVPSYAPPRAWPALTLTLQAAPSIKHRRGLHQPEPRAEPRRVAEELPRSRDTGNFLNMSSDE